MTGICLIPGGGGGRIVPINIATKTATNGWFEVRYTPPDGSLTCVTFLAFSKEGYHFSDAVSRNGEVVYLGSTLPKLSSVSATSFRNVLTPGMLAAAFNNDLFPASPTPQPGRKLLLQERDGIEREAQLLFVSPTQINFVVPDNLPEGVATLKLVNGSQLLQLEFAPLARLAPGLFSANADGCGVAAAVALRIKTDGTQTYEAVAQFDQQLKKYVPLPIDLGGETERVFLVLFGSGLRHRASLEAATARIGSVTVQPTFAGA